MKHIKLALRILAIPIIAIPIIVLGWLSQTFCGLTIVAGILGIIFLPFWWIADNRDGVNSCFEIMEIAFCGIVFPFVYLYYFIIGGEKFKEFQI